VPHSELFGTCVHPPIGSQPSTVHETRSSQVSGGPPAQLVPEHRSIDVHALKSSHGPPFGVNRHPDAESQESSVHSLLSSQDRGPPGRHAPPLQKSPTVQVSLSLQEPPSGA